VLGNRNRIFGFLFSGSNRLSKKSSQLSALLLKVNSLTKYTLELSGDEIAAYPLDNIIVTTLSIF